MAFSDCTPRRVISAMDSQVQFCLCSFCLAFSLTGFCFLEVFWIQLLFSAAVAHGGFSEVHFYNVTRGWEIGFRTSLPPCLFGLLHTDSRCCFCLLRRYSSERYVFHLQAYSKIRNWTLVAVYGVRCETKTLSSKHIQLLTEYCCKASPSGCLRLSAIHQSFHAFSLADSPMANAHLHAHSNPHIHDCFFYLFNIFTLHPS